MDQRTLQRVVCRHIGVVGVSVVLVMLTLSAQPRGVAAQMDSDEHQDTAPPEAKRQPGSAEALTDDQMTIKTDSGHRILVPNDWPIEHRGALISPAPVEQYLSMKFGQVKDKFSETDRRLDALEHQLQQSEEERKALLTRLRVLEETERQRATQEVTHGHTTQER